MARFKVYDDTNYHELLDEGRKYGLGYKGPGDRNIKGLTSIRLDCPPRSDWSAIIKERKEKKESLRYFTQKAGVKIKNQLSTPFCWVFAVTRCVECLAVQQRQPYVSLSPASVGAVIKNFQQEGGWGSEALKGFIELGAVPSDKWPDTSLSRSYYNAETNALRPEYKVLEFWQLPAFDFEQVAAVAFSNLPGAAGLLWWQHEVMYDDIDEIEPNSFGVWVPNSWGAGWGQNGYCFIREEKFKPDELVVPRVLVAK